MELILWMILCGSFVYLMLYFLSLGAPASTSVKVSADETSSPPPPLSVIICAHNEATQIKKNLPLVLQQVYPEFEVIVVNDDSTDDTQTVLKQFQNTFHHLKVIEVKAGEKKFAGKKELLAKAMRAAKHETIIVTDADCFPASNNWLNAMSQYAAREVKVVLGYSPFTDTDAIAFSDAIGAGERLLNKLIRFEATQTAWQYFANAIKGKAYMGVGRNMLFRKTDYLRWFETSEHKTAGGDDDLFVNWLVNEKNKHTPTPLKRGIIAVCLDEAAFVFTEPETTYNSWLMQKTRHAQASYYYTWSDKIKLFGFALAQFCLYAAGIALLFFSCDSWCLVLSIITSFSMMQMFASRNIYNTLRQQDVVLWIPLLQPLYVFSISLIFLLSLIKRSDTWN
jgi:biofilm PGA synthesis N-glycosyltransferase PgaC